MRLRLRRFSRYRPRVLTLLVFVVTAALIVLANLSFDQVSDWFAGFGVRSYGWPLVWHRYVLLVSDFPSTVGWYYSANRLAGNLALWILLLTLPAVACEWLLRRYRPRPNWSLRTLLVGVGAAAAMCGLFAALRDRAALRNALIAKLQGGVWVQRSGPEWLDLVGADPKAETRTCHRYSLRNDFAHGGQKWKTTALITTRLLSIIPPGGRRAARDRDFDRGTPVSRRNTGAIQRLRGDKRATNFLLTRGRTHESRNTRSLRCVPGTGHLRSGIRPDG
jgi:hypothetical protein